MQSVQYSLFIYLMTLFWTLQQFIACICSTEYIYLSIKANFDLFECWLDINYINMRWLSPSSIIFSQLLIFFVLLLHFPKKHAHCFQLVHLFFFSLLLWTKILLVTVLNNVSGTLSWFLVFLGKKLLKIWKSVPYFLSSSMNSSF